LSIATTTKRRKTRRAVCVPVYLAVINGTDGTTRPGLANLSRELAEHFCTSFNQMSNSRATVHTVRVRLPATK
jgi:hypothetical protein